MENIFEFYQRVLELKKIKRSGWIKRDVNKPESDADHSWGLALLGYVISKKLGLNSEVVMIQSLIHEIGEVVAGDITPNDGILAEEKYRIEFNAAQELLSVIDKNGYLFELWRDFEEERTKEGRLVKQLDKLEMMYQVYNYEVEQDMNMNDFYEYMDCKVEKNFFDEEILLLYSEVRIAKKENNILYNDI